MSRTVLVTGGSGFVGSHLVGKLLAQGDTVRIFDLCALSDANNLEHLKDHPNLYYVQGDITDAQAVANIVTSDLDLIYHLSAIVGIKHYVHEPLKVIDVNVIGTRHLLAAATEHGIKVLLTSTSEIYGNNPDVPWQEDGDRVLGATDIDRWSYSTSKAICEHMMFGMHRAHGLPISIVRFFNVYGPRQNPIFVLSQSVQRVLEGDKPLLYDGGEQTRCFTYVEDVVDAVIQIAESDKTNGEIYNVGSDKEITIKEALTTLCHVANVPVEFEPVNTEQHYQGRYQDIIRRVPCVDKVREHLGWQATTTLEQGLEQIFAWQRNHTEEPA